MDVFATIIIFAEEQAAAQEIEPGAFTTGLSPTGLPPVTNYISSGYIPEEDLAQLAALPDTDVSDEDPFTAMARLGLQMVQEPQPVASD